MSIADFLGAISRVILNPLIILGFVVASVFFFWGIFEFIIAAGNEGKLEQGKKNMFWGLVGLFIMFSVIGIINIILNTFGIDPGSEYVDTLLQ